MQSSRGRTISCLAFWLFVLFVSGVRTISGERLPVRLYTTADGLPVDTIKRIKLDSHGFLWFCTRDSLSRFDGYQFTNYYREQGLSHPLVNDLIEASSGTYWVATNGGGVCSFNPAKRVADNSTSRFKSYLLENQASSNLVNCLCEDREGRIWAGTDQGLFYFDQTSDRFVAAIPGSNEIYALLADRQGGLWIGAGNQLWRRTADGKLSHYSFQVDKNPGRFFSLLEDDKGNLWAGSAYAGLFEIAPQLLPQQDTTLREGQTKALLKHLTTVDGAVIGTVQDLHQSSDGHIWVVAQSDYPTSLGGGLFEFDGKIFRHYGRAQGLSNDQLLCMAEDKGGNLWLGSIDGAMKIVRNGLTTIGEADGLRNGPSAIFENHAGELCAITEKALVVNRYADGRFRSTRLNIPRSLENSKFWGANQITFQDREGDWWAPTTKGLIRFPNAPLNELSRARPKAHYSLEGNNDWFDVFRMYEDARGDIWLSLSSNAKNALVKWERATETFRYYSEADGIPYSAPTAFREDAQGNLWIGLYDGGLLRYHAGRFTVFGTADGLPTGYITNLYLDRNHRLWIASSSDGAARIDDPAAERPVIARYVVADGLSSNVVLSITEDDWGRIYFSTPRSIDRVNPASGGVKHYTAADGLPKGGARVSFRDRYGTLWFSGFREIARLVPEQDEEQLPPPVLITGVRVNGDLQPIADLGETAVGGLELATNRNHLQIDFVGLAFGVGEALQYQYKLEGADPDWRPVTALRSVNYASLTPGGYRFLVRAMSPEGQFSQNAASVEFRILSPFYRRSWFLALATLAVFGCIYMFYRYRVSQLLMMERMRTRIASDLHDDIGANLTKIGILSEVVRQQVNGQGGMAETLLSIARISRESVSSMSDIVWAINPNRDTLQDLTRRMREFAGEMLANRDIEFELRAPTPETYLRLGADVRRTIFLIFKEAINNIVRHSNCTKAEIDLSVDGPLLLLSVSDDGQGFNATRDNTGNGLASMKRRAASMGGEVEIDSHKPAGTRVTLRLPTRQGKLNRDAKVRH